MAFASSMPTGDPALRYHIQNAGTIDLCFGDSVDRVQHKRSDEQLRLVNSKTTTLEQSNSI